VTIVARAGGQARAVDTEKRSFRRSAGCSRNGSSAPRRRRRARTGTPSTPSRRDRPSSGPGT